ncbi:MAG: tetratricopeptide repeat protein [Planctomycetia bacterium]
MRYDREGFPLPSEFEGPRDDLEAFGPVPGRGRAGAPSPAGTARGGGRGDPPPRSPFAAERSARQVREDQSPLRRKRYSLLFLVAAVLVPAVAIPELLPVVRDVVVEWSLHEAAGHEARGDVVGALGAVERAVAWHAEDADLLVRRGQLRLQNRDPAGAIRDANQAVVLAPFAPQARRLRALVHTVLERPDEALADAEAVVGMTVPGDPESLNLRAYTRALVKRDLPEALADIELAIERGVGDLPEHLDTRGYILHLLGRHHEAIDDLNRAIDGMQALRDRLEVSRGRVDPTELELRLRSVDQGLAVMHQHRGEACAAAGFEAQARQDLDLAVRKGFDPTRGVF